MGVDAGDRGRGRRPRRSACRPRISRAPTTPSPRSRSRSSRATDADPHAICGWPFFDDGTARSPRELEAWARADLAGVHAHDDVDAACRAPRARARRGRLAAATRVPAEYGGRTTLDVRSLCLAARPSAYTGLADFAFAMQGLGSGPITLYGTAELKQRYLPDVARRRARSPPSRSPSPTPAPTSRAMSTTATRDGDGMCARRRRRPGSRTAASPTSTSSSPAPAKRPARAASRAFVVEADTPGFAIAERIEVIAPHPLATLRFEDCRVPARTGSARRARASGSRWRRSTSSARRWAPPRWASPGARSTRRSPRPRRASCSAGRWPTPARRRPRSPTWRPTIDAARAARLPRRLDQGHAARRASPARRRWPRCIATEAAQQRHRRARCRSSAACGVTRGEKVERALPRDPRAAHLRGRDRGAEAGHRPRAAECAAGRALRTDTNGARTPWLTSASRHLRARQPAAARAVARAAVRPAGARISGAAELRRRAARPLGREAAAATAPLLRRPAALDLARACRAASNRIANVLVERARPRAGQPRAAARRQQPDDGRGLLVRVMKAGGVVVATMPLLRAQGAHLHRSTRRRSRWRSATRASPRAGDRARRSRPT